MGGGGGGSCDDDRLFVLLLSEDVLIEILLLLPVISLLRFKSVCKSWRSMIESPFFIHLHYHAATTLPTSSSSKLGNNNILLFRSGMHEELEEEDQMANISTVSGEKFDVFESFGIPPLQKFDDIINRKGYYDEMVGCCDGIICLHDTMNRWITLWNPATKQHRFLPKPSNLLGNPNCIMQDDNCYYVQDFVKFGIDVKTKDHKLLQITTLKRCRGEDLDHIKFIMCNEGRSVHVYSSCTDSWRCIDDAANTISAAHPELEMDTDDRGYLNGRCFFTAQYCVNEAEEQFMSLILSFDFTEEIFRTIQPPYDRRSRHSDNIFFIPFGEKIALADVKKPGEDYNSYSYDIWVLNEGRHGVEEEESWTKFYTFGPYNKHNPPRCITNNGEFGIIYGWHWPDAPMLQVLNLLTGETIDLQWGSKRITDVGAYKPSLIPIGGNGATDIY